MRQSAADDYARFAVARAGHLYRSACLLTAGDTHLAEDLVQETPGRLYVRWGRVSRAAAGPHAAPSRAKPALTVKQLREIALSPQWGRFR